MGGEVIRFEGAAGFGGGKPEKPAPTDIDLRLARFPLTDLGNAERFIARFGDEFLWCGEIGWAYWDGRRWNFDDAETRLQIAVQETVRAIQGEAAALRESDFDVVVTPATRTKGDVWLSDKVAAWGRVSEGDARLKAMPNQAKPMLAARPGDFDADRMKMTVLNGTLHFRRPEACPETEDLVILAPHDRADRITKLAPVTYDPKAPAPVFSKFLGQIQPDEASRRMLQQWFGYNATGLTSEQKLVFLYGKGRNGKSTLVELVAALYGDYSSSLPIETFLDQGAKRKGSDASPDLAGTKGVRLLRTSEPEKRSKLAEALIKLVTGGETMRVRFLNKDFFDLRPDFKLTISGNYRPEISGTDDGIWNRMMLVKFPARFLKKDADPTLPARLLEEGSGVLNWCLDGLRDWLENGLTVSEDVRQATEDYRNDSDPLGRFLEHCTRPSLEGRVQSSKLHALFIAFAKSHGEAEWTNKGFTAAMKERGFRTKQSDVMWWLEIETTKSVEDFALNAGDESAPEPDGRPFAERHGEE